MYENFLSFELIMVNPCSHQTDARRKYFNGSCSGSMVHDFPKSRTYPIWVGGPKSQELVIPRSAFSSTLWNSECRPLRALLFSRTSAP
ncbi:hypothetical protein VNO77_18733 [Canavalia gladiata]|uniref:Uncharacterized protein n=1 Tax=Canavalia gladiata TaxID=3824 RepID=A0AAN9QNY7_CANGL